MRNLWDRLTEGDFLTDERTEAQKQADKEEALTEFLDGLKPHLLEVGWVLFIYGNAGSIKGMIDCLMLFPDGTFLTFIDKKGTQEVSLKKAVKRGVDVDLCKKVISEKAREFVKDTIPETGEGGGARLFLTWPAQELLRLTSKTVAHTT